MARIIYGSRGRQWRGSEWVVRNALELLVPQLESMQGGSAIVGIIRTAMAEGRAIIDLTEIMRTVEILSAWDNAVMRTIAEFYKEGNAQWNEPDAFGAFLGAVGRLVEIVGATVDEFQSERYFDFETSRGQDPIVSKTFWVLRKPQPFRSDK